MEAAPRFELGMKVLQTSALPLGYAASKLGAIKKDWVSFTLKPRSGARDEI